MKPVTFLFGLSVVVGCSSNNEAETPGSAVRESASTTRSAPAGKEIPTVVYAHHSTGDLSLDIIKPAAGKALKRAILLIHGGGWVGGSRTEMDSIGSYLAEKGFFVASVDYRLAHTAIWPAQLDDVQTAVRYLRSHAKDLDISADKIGAAGISAGGHLSAFLGTVDTRAKGEYPNVSSRVQAVGSISGIHDLNAPLTPGGEKYGIVQQLVGEHGTPDKKAREDASPQTFFDAKTAPTLFIQGAVDPLVPAEQSTAAAARLKALHVPCEVVMVPGMGHGLSPTPPEEVKALDRLAEWMTQYLK